MNRHIQTIFCDDIRHELGGKLSFIGVYTGHLFVRAFPVTLPKLCLALTAITPASQPFQKLDLRILKDEEILAEGSLDESMLSNVAAAAGEADGPDGKENRVQVLNSLFVFSPFQIDAPCRLRVRAVTESGELKGLSLMIAEGPVDIPGA
ncbi:MAG: hypothetical protein KUL75_03030 [Sterolibacterium sp.]|nr:hypothetical protein [Sterolibacterium sp.]